MKQSIKTIYFHYLRQKEDYQGFKIYLQNEEGEGISIPLHPDKSLPGFSIATTTWPYDQNSSTLLSFKPYRGDFAEVDERSRRFIDLNHFTHKSDIHIYIRQGDPLFTLTKPVVHKSIVQLYYHRHDGDCFGWHLNYFFDKNNSHQFHIPNFVECAEDPRFFKVTFPIYFLEENKELHFYLRNGSMADPIDYRRFPLQKNKMNIYMVEGVAELFHTKKQALKHFSPKIVKAVFHNIGSYHANFNTIWAETNIPLSSDFLKCTEHFLLTDEKGCPVPIQQINFSDASCRRFQVITKDYFANPFLHRYDFCITNISMDVNENDKTPPCRVSIQRLFDWDDFHQHFSNILKKPFKELGLSFTETGCTFALWAPTKDFVSLCLYENGSDTPLRMYDMHFLGGFWTISFNAAKTKTMFGLFYNFSVTEGLSQEIVMDPYAKACNLNATQAAIIDLATTNPPNFHNHERPLGPLKNSIIYEFHIRDLTEGDASGVPEHLKGTYLGVIHKIPYLKSLGVNCVQILPVTKFDSDETKKDGGGYNWGYDQVGLWFLPEGIYSTDPQNPVSRIREFKEMVMAFHKAGIRVVIDGVHNHTYLTENSPLNKIVPDYYYRKLWDDSFSNGSGCGNELKTERPMVSHLVCEYLRYWVEEMGVDGFRFDLMSLTDKATMHRIKKQFSQNHPHTLLYGEAYQMGWSILPFDQQACKENFLTEELKGIGAFTDRESRSAIRGYNHERGLASGVPIDSEASHLFFVGQKAEFIALEGRNTDTAQAFHYVDIHDDMLLLDHLHLPYLQFSPEEIMARYKLAYSMLFNYIGAVVLKAGVEISTSKNGDFNSYRSEKVNLIDWKKMHSSMELWQFFQRYIKFRSAHPAYWMPREEVHAKFEIVDAHFGRVKGKLMKNHANNDPFEKLLIFHNLSHTELPLLLPHEESGWALIADMEHCGHQQIGQTHTHKLLIPPLTTFVLCDHKSLLNNQKEVHT